MIFKPKICIIIDSNLIFWAIVAIFILSLAIITCDRGGKDLNVGLFGVTQVLQKKSPYENPTDANRTIYRYAPGLTILEYPFLLKARMTAPFRFVNALPSILSWYWLKIFALLISALILLRLIPASSKGTSVKNLKMSFLMSLPLIGYELSNSQNKLIALLFMLLSIFLFEENRLFLSAISFSLALTVYIALLPFVLYFILRKRKFIFEFIVACLIVFFIFPSLIFGLRFNIFLLKEWFLRSLKPFFFTASYASYIDLRDSSQSLPSAIGRLFVSGHTGTFKYFISPLFVHIIIRVSTAIILLLSCMAVLRRSKGISRGLEYAVFLILALLLPQYCIYYTWSWVFVFYFAAFNYISYPQVPPAQKRLLITLVSISYISLCLMGIHRVNHFSFIFWATLLLWLGMVIALRWQNGVRSIFRLFSNFEK